MRASSLSGNLMTVRQKTQQIEISAMPSLKPDTYDEGRIHAPGWDIRVLESEWREWVRQKKIKVKNPDANFIKFCKTKGSYQQGML